MEPWQCALPALETSNPAIVFFAASAQCGHSPRRRARMLDVNLLNYWKTGPLSKGERPVPERCAPLLLTGCASGSAGVDGYIGAALGSRDPFLSR